MDVTKKFMFCAVQCLTVRFGFILLIWITPLERSTVGAKAGVLLPLLPDRVTRSCERFLGRRHSI